MYGLLRDYANDNRTTNPELYESQKVVCLTETPLEHVWMMYEDIADRTHPLAPYGLAFSKSWARGVGANPVWYIDTLRTGHGGRDWITVPLFNLAEQAVRGGGETYADPFDLGDGASPAATALQLHRSPIADTAPFIETMGPVGPPGAVRRREFSWEREWRHRGGLSFSIRDLVAAFAPEARHGSIDTALDGAGMAKAPLLDPTWGLERMIAALAGVGPEFAGPLPRY